MTTSRGGNQEIRFHHIADMGELDDTATRSFFECVVDYLNRKLDEETLADMVRALAHDLFPDDGTLPTADLHLAIGELDFRVYAFIVTRLSPLENGRIGIDLRHIYLSPDAPRGLLTEGLRELQWTPIAGWVPPSKTTKAC